MSTNSSAFVSASTKTFAQFLKRADYSLINSLQADPQSTDDGNDHKPRQVFSGHYVPVTPISIQEPEYVVHSKALFDELGLSHELAQDAQFRCFIKVT